MKADLNNDSLIGYREAIIALHKMGQISKEKAVQVDCSECLTDPSSFYL